MDYCGYPIEVQISSNKPFLISCGVLEEHLPYLRLTPVIWPAHNVPDEDQYTRTALMFLFDHLSEITKTGTSAALLDHLEASFKRDFRRRRDTTVEIFSNLGRVLQPEWWGCSCEVFSALSTFFTRNCERIYQRDPESLVDYLSALNYMRWPMTEVLACVARHPSQAEMVLFCAQATEEDEHPLLDPEVMNELLVLTGQKVRRIRKEEGSLVRAGYRQRGGLMIGGRRMGGHGRFLRGDQLGFTEILEAWDRRPENVFVKLDGRRGAHRRAEQRLLGSFEDYDSHDSSEDEFGFGYLGRGRRRGRRTHGMGMERGLGMGLEHPRLMLTGC
ncbi:hypothetical protein MMC30_002966 [Trapelia coarctata]|nr:hypothetical protein [Trapelia coarctata]